MKLTKKLILASGSPRRREILEKIGLDFIVKTIPTDESYDPDMSPKAVPEFLATKKIEASPEYPDDTLLLAADTVVIVNNRIFNKPLHKANAAEMLLTLSGKSHQVVTGVCLKTGSSLQTFSDTTTVHFSKLSPQEIEYYVEAYHPFDKAGAYGVQDFIGMIGIDKLEGSFYTVMGLPIHKVYQALKPYIQF